MLVCYVFCFCSPVFVFCLKGQFEVHTLADKQETRTVAKVMIEHLSAFLLQGGARALLFI